MDEFIKTYQVRWADLDPNQHLRHSAYNDIAAHMRIMLLEAAGVTMDKMRDAQLGPVLFREETVFRREVGAGETISVDSKLLRARENGSRWSFIQEFYKQDGVKAATLTVDGAWLSLVHRKLTMPPEEMTAQFLSIPRVENFEFDA